MVSIRNSITINLLKRKATMYFINHIQTYCSVNAKGKELQQFVVDNYKHALVSNDIALESLRTRLKNKVKELNEKYPRTKPIVYEEIKGSGYICVKPENHYNDNHIFSLSYTKVRTILELKEENNDAETNT